MKQIPTIHSMYIGQTKTLEDAQGTWQSSIARDQVQDPVFLEKRGFVGDQATQPYHGHLETAVCGHFLDHYHFWQEKYNIVLKPGGVGENWTIAGATEETIFVGDVYQVGTAVVQVSCPRIPCQNQARHVGQADWVKLTLKELRTGIYLRVLEEGSVPPGVEMILQDRPNPDHSMADLNRCYYHDFDPDQARKFSTMPGLMPYWQERFAKKLAV